jgi:hypothetical protein
VGKRRAQVLDLAPVIAEAKDCSRAIACDQLERPLVDLADRIDPLHAVGIDLANGLDESERVTQLGLLDASRLPVAGAETARKVVDPSLPSNGLIERAAAGG